MNVFLDISRHFEIFIDILSAFSLLFKLQTSGDITGQFRLGTACENAFLEKKEVTLWKSHVEIVVHVKTHAAFIIAL